MKKINSCFQKEKKKWKARRNARPARATTEKENLTARYQLKPSFQRIKVI